MRASSFKLRRRLLDFGLRSRYQLEPREQKESAQ
jgi:hypothetical protein